MAPSQRENLFAVTTTKRLAKSTISVILCGVWAVCAQAQDAQSNNTNESWTSTTQNSGDHTNPSRTTESHTKSGNRSVDQQSVEVLGPDGRYQHYYDTETETTEVNATTTRTAVRTYRWDANGQQRYLVQVTEEEAQSSASGDAHVVSTTSNSDVNGNLRVVQREVTDTRKTSPDAQETRTTFYVTDGSGGFTPSLKTHEVQTINADHSVAVNKTTLLPDGNGNWEVGEVKENTIKEDGKNRASEERVLRPNSQGGLSEVSRTVGEETETVPGEKRNTVETYSTNTSGLASDGTLHLNWRVTTVQKKDSDGGTTEQQVEQPNPDNTNAGLQVNAKTKYTVHYAASGTQQTKTVQTRDINGNFNAVSVETKKSDQVPAEVEKTPSDKPK
jgi:hypothetical protein